MAMIAKKVPNVLAARVAAARVIQDYGLRELPVDPFAVARGCEIIVEAKPSSHDGFSGMLARVGDSFGILYATHVSSPGFQRFSVGHELGHYFLEGHVDHLLGSGPHASRSGFIARNPYEVEADLFSSALLLPPHLIGPILSREADGMTAVCHLASLARTSLTATAVAYVQQTTSAIAVVQSRQGVVEFCIYSDAMKAAGVRWLRNGDLVPLNTLTATLQDPRAVKSVRSAQIGLAQWFQSPLDHAAHEDVIGLGTFDRLLTVVRCDRLSLVAGGYEDDVDEEAELIERWTPRFR